MAALFVGPSSHVMRKSEAMFLKTLCWLAVGGFAFVSVGMHRLLAEATRDSAVRWCGNGITDPLSAILSFGTPLGVSAVVLLGTLWRQGLATVWSFVSASLIVFGCTASLLISGVRFFRDFLSGFYLSDIVWWMKPIGGLIGV